MSRTKYLKCACRHCGGHIEFPVAAAGMAATCPHCTRDTDLPAAPSGHRALWMVLSVVVAAVFVASAAGVYWWQQSQKARAAKNESTPGTASETPQPPARLPH